ncbi:MAG: LLM class flavin-dependent oxidoreductase [Acidimicrobiia bacterium]
MNLSWDEVRDAALTAEALGFDEFFTSDHLMGVAGFDPEKAGIDAVGLLLALAPLTSTIRLGCLVSPVTYRGLVILLRQLQAVDVISGGRAVAGLGAGWNRDEHERFGFEFGTIKERLDMLEAACQQTLTLWPQLRPRAPQEHVRMLIAGGSPRVLRMAVRYADGWHVMGTPAFVEAKLAELQATAKATPRERPQPLETTVGVIATLSDDAAVIEMTRKRMAETASQAAAAPSNHDRAQGRSAVDGDEYSTVFVGGEDELRRLVQRYRDSGVDRLILSLPKPYSRATLERLARAAMS